ncbi:NADP-dependent oxidoreductase [Polyangium aurulentum]|nr:NADP-dependent oxidoreductase [Polyangium aurulentum]
MRGIALDRFGGPEGLSLRTLPVPDVGPDEVLIRVEVAGVGEWDPFEREGGYAAMLGSAPQFPYVLGSEGAGTVVAIGANVRRFREGDQVYALGFLNPKGGFYAEYAAVAADCVSPLPGKLTIEQAGVMGGVGITALRGLEDTLRLKAGESVLIFGASGGIGHVAVQLAKRMGARVFAVASGADGVAFVERLGADAVVDGRKDDVQGAARAFAPDGLDAALLTAGGKAAEEALLALREGGRVAYPNGVQPEPRARPTVQLGSYNGEPDRDIITRLDRLIEAGPFEAHIARTFPLAEAAEAHRALSTHYLGKLALRVSG